MIAQTLSIINDWFNEPTESPERPKLLSKIALLELCGWLEEELDRIVLAMQTVCLNDDAWTQAKLIDRTYGFKYNQHFRPMLAGIVGERGVRKIEQEVETNSPGDIERLQSYTSALWNTRCSFAHADLASNEASMQRFDAPNKSMDQYTRLSNILTRLEASALTLAAAM